MAHLNTDGRMDTGTDDTGIDDTGIDVCGIGSALVDVLVETTDDVIVRCGLVKGSMQLMDLAGAERVHAQVPGGRRRSGGSVANTIAGLAALGARVGFIGRVADDPLGAFFVDDMTALGVRFSAARPAQTGSTGRCLVLITPDAERTMCTTLGVAAQLGPEDLDLDLVGRSQVTYLEGYLWDAPVARDAFRAAIDAAHRAGRKTAMSMSDPLCVDRHRDQFSRLVAEDLDIVVGNEPELCSLTQVGDLTEACRRVRRPGLIVTVTRGAAGAWVLEGEAGAVIEVPVPAPATVVDTTGAGDLYAAGFLHGLTHGLDLRACALLGNVVAGEAVGHMGARPEADLGALAHAVLD